MKHLYASTGNPQLTVNTSHGELVFKDSSCTLDDENEHEAAMIEELDGALENNPSIMALIAKVDRAEAERVVREHMEQQQREEEMRQSISGTMGSDVMRRLEQGPEVLPGQLRQASGTGNATDGLKLSELQQLIKKNSAEEAESDTAV